MTTDKTKYLKNIVDGSGFPLQVKLEDVINNTPNWYIEGREVFWKQKGRNGFIDIVASHSDSPVKLFIEAKKASGGEWIFLSHEKQGKKDERAIVLTGNRQKNLYEWNEVVIPISTEKFSFCAVAGQKNSPNPLLERLGSELIMSMEGYLLNQDFNSVRWNRGVSFALPDLPSVISVIVTNTSLYKCYYDPDSVDLTKGIITGNSEFEEVKYLSFSKPFWSEIVKSSESSGYLSKYSINEKLDRTIFIVNSNSLKNFLIDLDPYQA